MQEMELNLPTYIKLLISIMLTGTPLISYNQFFENGSFEGPGGENQPPSPWISCESSINYPDGGDLTTISIDLPASEGETYLSMRVRGTVPPENLKEYADTREFCSTALLKTLQKGLCYTLSVDMAYDGSVTYVSENTFVLPTIFRVWGTYDGCTGVELLAESELVDNKDWENFQFTIVPQYSSYDSLYIEPYYSEEILFALGTDDTTYNGLLLIDNLILTEGGTNVPRIVLDTIAWLGDSLILHAGNGSNYEWEYSLGLSCNDCQSPGLIVSSDVTYLVNFEGSKGCPVQELFAISLLNCEKAYPSNPVIRLDTLVIDITSIELEASEGVSYNWSPEDFVTCFNCRVTMAHIENSTTFECTIEDEHNCSITEIFMVTRELTYPNVITPNGDGINDEFGIRGLPPNSTFKVYSRSGTLVTKIVDYQNNWSGQDQNEDLLPEDTYWFTLTNEDFNINESGYIFIKL